MQTLVPYDVAKAEMKAKERLTAKEKAAVRKALGGTRDGVNPGWHYAGRGPGQLSFFPNKAAVSADYIKNCLDELGYTFAGTDDQRMIVNPDKTFRRTYFYAKDCPQPENRFCKDRVFIVRVNSDTDRTGNNQQVLDDCVEFRFEDWPKEILKHYASRQEWDISLIEKLVD